MSLPSPSFVRVELDASKVGTNFADKRRSLGIVRLRTQAKEFVLFVPENTHIVRIGRSSAGTL
jgi:hypothetical protein